jgi:hypothetical protein
MISHYPVLECLVAFVIVFLFGFLFARANRRGSAVAHPQEVARAWLYRARVAMPRSSSLGAEPKPRPLPLVASLVHSRVPRPPSPGLELEALRMTSSVHWERSPARSSAACSAVQQAMLPVGRLERRSTKPCPTHYFAKPVVTFLAQIALIRL